VQAIEQRYSAVRRQVELACSAKDEEISSALCQHCSVLLCGFVERSIETVVLARLKNRAHPKVLNFVKSHFKRGANYNCSAISELPARFEMDWKDKFEHFMEHHEREVEVLRSADSIRNSVAHGASARVSATDLKERAEHVKVIVDAVIHSTS